LISVALHTIGQTPRPDLTPFIVAALSIRDITTTGALDSLALEDLQPVSQGDYPLETRLKDGSRVEVSVSFLEPLIQAQIDRLDDDENLEVDLHIVLCAGPFPALVSGNLLIRPFENACDVFQSQSLEQLLVVVPFQGQIEPAVDKWSQAGYRVTVKAMDERDKTLPADAWLTEIGQRSDAQALVLDYVGYPKAVLDSVNNALSIPVFDLGHLATDYARQVIDEIQDMMSPSEELPSEQ